MRDDLNSLSKTSKKFSMFVNEFLRHACSKNLLTNCPKALLTQYEADLVNNLKTQKAVAMSELFWIYKLLVIKSVVRSSDGLEDVLSPILDDN